MTRIPRLSTLLVGGLVAALLPFLQTPTVPEPAGGAGAIREVSPELELASSSYLCTGYTSCRSRGYSDGGYGAANSRMYWGMYPGHNCTNYVAYRMIQAGMPNVRPWSGTGMAYNWGFAMSQITDRTPRVGAVAWWNRNVSGAGSSGHVAIVEKVISSREIIVSEDSWGGDFAWRRIVNDGSSWPTGFIHFADKGIENTARPTISRRARVGNTLVADKGTWAPPASYSYQWLADGRAIAGATERRLYLGARRLGQRLKVRVHASKPGFTSTSADSAAKRPVVKGRLHTEQRPVVSGKPEVGEVLTATQGTWTPRPDTTSLRWEADGKIIQGQTGKTLQLTRELAGKEITVAGVARRDGYQKKVTRARPVGPVVEGVIEVVQPFGVAGRPRVGEDLKVTPGTFTPRGAEVSYAWLRDGTPIAGATEPTYRVVGADAGARLSALVTMSKENYEDVERKAGTDGVVTTASELVVATTGKSRAATVRVDVLARGVDEPTGRVRIEIGGKSDVVQLEQGTARVTIEGLAAGQRTVKVSYPGTDVVRPSSASAQVRVSR